MKIKDAYFTKPKALNPPTKDIGTWGICKWEPDEAEFGVIILADAGGISVALLTGRVIRTRRDKFEPLEYGSKICFTVSE